MRVHEQDVAPGAHEVVRDGEPAVAGTDDEQLRVRAHRRQR